MEGVPRRKTSYGKIQGWVRKDNYITVRALFFGEDDEPIKEARLGEVRQVEGVSLAHRIAVRSLVRDSRTVLTLTDVRINQGLSPELFTESALKGK
jgi:hypothetical protein